MRIIVCENYEELSEKAAQIVASQIILKPDCTLGLATGATPVGLYDKLIERFNRGELDFSLVKTFNLDEYYPIKRANTQSYYHFMWEHLFSRVNINPENTHIPDGEAPDPAAECARYEKMIAAEGGVDLQILGIGKNGHIGFNEPGTPLDSRTHLTDLTSSTINANSRYFDSPDDVPKQALTMGVATILKAKKIVLVASGASKSRAVSELIAGGVNPDMPASALNTHPDVVLICDKNAYMGARLGVDIGGTYIKFIVVDNSNIKYKNTIPTANTKEKILDDIAAECAAINQKYTVKTVGVGTPGLIKDGRVSADNLPFKDLPLEKELSARIGLPVTVDNDANCAALGEIDFGTEKDKQNIVLVTLGTGVGGGIIVNRRIVRGNNSAGEIGHMIINAENGLPCPCGLHGCFEQYASISALVRQSEAMAAEKPNSLLASLMNENGGKLDGKLIFKAYYEHCPAAQAVMDTYLHYLAVGIDSLANIFGPDAIVLAGGITKEGEGLLAPLRAKLHTKSPVTHSSLQSDAGALGAAML